MLEGREKSIVRVRTTQFIFVHSIVLGHSMHINHTLDMVMIHFKSKVQNTTTLPILQNPFVKKALQSTLF